MASLKTHNCNKCDYSFVGSGKPDALMRGPTIPSLNNERVHSRIEGTSYNFLENDIELNKALEKVWDFIWENHCTKKGAFTIERTSRQF